MKYFEFYENQRKYFRHWGRMLKLIYTMEL